MKTDRAYLLAVESSCDDTSVAILLENQVLSNIVSSQLVHNVHGGVVPELASREHEKNLLWVCKEALEMADVTFEDIAAVAFTQGPGLPGSLLVGTSFAKGLSLRLGVPLIAVNHMEAHILSVLLAEDRPEFPFIALVVSGGHTLLVLVKNWDQMEVLGSTQDDAVGEAFDKCAKMLGLGYPGGKKINELAAQGDPHAFEFPIARIPGYGFSYSGVKTAFLYFLQRHDPAFIQERISDVCASLQQALLSPLIQKAMSAMEAYDCRQLGVSGGVAANSELRRQLFEQAEKRDWKVYFPAFEYCTDNAGMIGLVGWLKWKNKQFSPLSIGAEPRLKVGAPLL